MKISDLATGALWSILPQALDELCLQFDTVERSNHAEAKMLAFVQTREKHQQKPYAIDRGVAVIPIVGPLTKRSSFFSYLFGARSYADLSLAVTEALQDRQVNAILLDIDSPGGTVDGTEAFTDLIYGARDQKPVVAFANGLMASAAYWAGSAARHIIAEPTASVGSIGVLTIHTEYSQMNQMDGIKRTVIKAGRDKALGNSAEPLSDADRAKIQTLLDHTYGLFVATVARNRGVTEDHVRADMAEGRLFIGHQALDNSLVDAIGSYADALDKAVSLADATNKPFQPFTAIKEAPMPAEDTVITTTQALATAYPDLVRQIRDQALADAKIDDQIATGVKAETDRILALFNAQFGEEPGQHFATIVNTGITGEQLAAIRGIKSGQADDQDKADPAMAAMLAAIQQAGPPDPGSDNGDGQAAAKPFMDLVAEHRAAFKCTRLEAMQAVMKANPKAHNAYLKEANLR